MLTGSAGPNGTLDPDKIVEVKDAFANFLIEQRVAEKAESDAKITGVWPHAQDVPKPEKGEK